MSATQVLADAQATAQLGAALAATAPGQALLFLRGELGAGKTTLTAGLLHSLGHAGACRSPTYTLVEPYRVGQRKVYHFDLYRLADPEELEFIGIRDYLSESALCIVEWPENAVGRLPDADLVVELDYQPDGRLARLLAGGKRGEEWLQRLAQRIELV